MDKFFHIGIFIGIINLKNQNIKDILNKKYKKFAIVLQKEIFLHLLQKFHIKKCLVFQ